MRFALLTLLLTLSGCFNHRLVLIYEQGDAALGSHTEVETQPATQQEKKDDSSMLTWGTANPSH